MPKKQSRPKTKYLNQSSKLELFLAKSKISNIFLRNVRRRKTGSSKVKIKGTKVRTSGPIYWLQNFLTFKKNLLAKIVAISLLALVLFGAYTFVENYNSIQFSPYLEDSISESNESSLDYFGPEYNVLISGFQKISNNRFAQLLLLVSLNSKTGDIRILSVNPNFITTSSQSNKKYTLKSLVNNVGSENIAHNYSESIEAFLGVRVDRYIYFDVDQFKNFLNDWDLSMKTIDGFNSSKGFYGKDSLISKSALAEYLFTLESNQSSDLLSSRQLSFFNQFLQNNRNLPFYIKSFFAADELTDIFHTNMNKSEMSGFLSSLMGSNLPAKSALIDSSLGFAGSTGTEEGLTINPLEFDNRIKDTLLNINIVKEQVNIEVYNASSVPGYASKIKRIFQNMGANIINTNNYPEKVEGVKLFIPNKNAENFPNNIAAIQYYFDDELQLIVGDYKYNHTADLILVLGE